MARWVGQIIVSLFAFSFPAVLSLPQPPLATVRPATPTPTPTAATVQIVPPVAAASVAAIDFESGATLFAQAADAPQPLASITKLMTALVAHEAHPDWQALVTVRQSDQREGGRVVLKAGDQVSVQDLFELMLVASSNEAAVALARATGLTQQAYVAAMNRHAQVLGLTSLRFVDVAGLEAGNVGSARDVARLGRLAIGNPAIASAVSRQSYTVTIRTTGERRVAPATNRLLQLVSSGAGFELQGGKTGYLDEVGYNLVVVVGQGGHRVSLALLGARSADSRWEETLRLARWIFSHYQWPALGG